MLVSLFISLILSLSVFSFSSYAGLTATTANTIEGTPPYLSFDGGITKATNTNELLMLKLSDGRIYKASDASATVATPIVLPLGDNSFADIETLIPQPNNSITLATLVTAPYNYAMDDDGDGNYSATGNLSIKIVDSDGKAVGRTGSLSICNSPYKVTLSSGTGGTLSTQFGAPHSSTFSGATAVYYIKYNSSTPVPYACFAKPDLNTNYSSPISQWHGTNGFKLQNIDVPNMNFPTTGFNGAFFDITLTNTTAAQVISSSGATVSAKSGTSNVTLLLTQISANRLRVTLKGPSSGQKVGGLGRIAVTGIPATFELKSGGTKIYNFRIAKWFIPRSGAIKYVGTPNAPTYCASIPGFRIPSVIEYTNQYTAAQTGIFGSTGGHYTRVIGGGVFAEWGKTDSSYYTGSDWSISYFFWANKLHSPYGSPTRYAVRNKDGFVAAHSETNTVDSVACVSP